MKIIRQIIDLSEVWALLLPLTFFLITKPSGKWLKPISFYLIITVFLNSINEFIFYPLAQREIVISNHVFYNISSIIRLCFFTWFFSFLYPFFRKLNRLVLPIFFLIAIVNFIFLEDILWFSSKLMALETGILLTYCIIWFNIKIRDENTFFLFGEATSWVVVGISIYAAVNFVLFLFYKVLIETENIFAYYIWDVHNIAFTIMCIFVIKAFQKR